MPGEVTALHSDAGVRMCSEGSGKRGSPGGLPGLQAEHLEGCKDRCLEEWRAGRVAQGLLSVNLFRLRNGSGEGELRCGSGAEGEVWAGCTGLVFAGRIGMGVVVGGRVA